ncbi:MAG: hypothetical protein NTU53_16940, partial [Planctomycetota bacterium]|nr:hypothetical protein [Planctomycetota bacterium]
MTALKKGTAQLLIVCISLLSVPANVHAWAPNDKDLDAAINTGDFAGHFANLSALLSQKVPAHPSSISESTLTALFKNPLLANALDQRQLIS